MQYETIQEAMAGAIPPGWVFYTADASVSGRVFVRLIRDAAGVEWWLGLSEEGREENDLYSFGRGRTIDEAVAEAVARINREVSDGMV